MPELPEVESTRRSLLRHVIERSVDAIEVRQPSLRRMVDTPRLHREVTAARIVGLRRRAKYLLFDLCAANQDQKKVTAILAVHLGMTGGLCVVSAKNKLRLHDHVSFQLDNGQSLRFNDARRFGSIDIFAPEEEDGVALFKKMGAEPFDAEAFDGTKLYQASRGTGRSLKQFLLDGRFVVGVGNIYASEALWRAELSPRLPASRLTRPKAERLVVAVVKTLEDAITYGGTTLRDFGDADGKKGGYGSRLVVYGREGEPCLRCKGSIQKIVQQQRSTYFCGRCQRR